MNECKACEVAVAMSRGPDTLRPDDRSLLPTSDPTDRWPSSPERAHVATGSGQRQKHVSHLDRGHKAKELVLSMPYKADQGRDLSS